MATRPLGGGGRGFRGKTALNLIKLLVSTCAFLSRLSVSKAAKPMGATAACGLCRKPLLANLQECSKTYSGVREVPKGQEEKPKASTTAILIGDKAQIAYHQ